MTDAELWTTHQVLSYLKIGRTKLWELVRAGAFPAYRIGDAPNGALRYRRDDIVAWLERQRVDARDVAVAVADSSASAPRPPR